MNRIRSLVVAFLLLAAVPAFAQRAVIIELPSGQLLGVAYTPTGQIVLTEVTVIKLPNPTPPPPVTAGTVWTVVIRTVDTMTTDQSKILSDLRQWSDQQPADKLAHWEFPPDAVGFDGARDKNVATYVAQIPATAKQPYVFVCQSRPDGKAVTLWQGELPPTADALISKIKEHIR